MIEGHLLLLSSASTVHKFSSLNSLVLMQLVALICCRDIDSSCSVNGYAMYPSLIFIVCYVISAVFYDSCLVFVKFYSLLTNYSKSIPVLLYHTLLIMTEPLFCKIRK